MQAIKAFVMMVKTQFESNVKIIRTDNRRVFANSNSHAFFEEKGITHQSICAYTPPQNGIVKRRHKTLLNITRALMMQFGVPKQ